MGLDNNRDYKDEGHLNHRGAVKASLWLARWLTDEHGVVDRRSEPFAARWNVALEQYDQMFVADW